VIEAVSAPDFMGGHVQDVARDDGTSVIVAQV
jgi:hypothetical protein